MSIQLIGRSLGRQPNPRRHKGHLESLIRLFSSNVCPHGSTLGTLILSRLIGHSIHHYTPPHTDIKSYPNPVRISFSVSLFSKVSLKNTSLSRLMEVGSNPIFKSFQPRV